MDPDYLCLLIFNIFKFHGLHIYTLSLLFFIVATKKQSIFQSFDPSMNPCQFFAYYRYQGRDKVAPAQ